MFADESGFNLAMIPEYAYAPKGERALASVPKNRGGNTSLIAAISLHDGVTAPMTLSGSIDGLAFEVWVREVLGPHLRPGQVVIIDRLNVHRRRRVKELIEASGCKVMFLPSYSPDLNPIEWAFSKIKNFVKAAKARTPDALDEAIAQAIKSVTLQDVRAWFELAGCPGHSLSGDAVFDVKPLHELGRTAFGT